MISKKDRRGAVVFGVIGRVLGIIFITIFIFNYVRTLANGEPLTVFGFLQQLSKVYSIPLPSLSSLNITADWGLFNFIKNFINTITSIFSFAVFFSVSAVNAVFMLLQIIPLLLAV